MLMPLARARWESRRWRFGVEGLGWNWSCGVVVSLWRRAIASPLLSKDETVPRQG